MTQYDIQNAIHTIDGYYIPRPGEPSSGAFQRAKVEAEKALQARLAHIEGISFGRWETARDHAQADTAPAGPDWAVLGPRLAAALKGAQQALRKALPHCPADEEHNGDSVFVGEWLNEVNETVALLPTPTLPTSQQIRVRACQIICNEHPEWGTWGVMEDRGEYFEIHGDRGGRVLFKSEADQSWSIVSA